jgi:hypothetical protein
MATAFSALEEIHIGDVGTIMLIEVFNGDARMDLSGATELQLHVYRKDKSSYILELDDLAFADPPLGTGDGVDGKIIYVSRAGDFTVKGEYSMQMHVKFSEHEEWSSSIPGFTVFSNLPSVVVPTV